MTAFKLSEIGEFLASHGFPNHIDGNGDVVIRSVNTLEDAGEGDLAFLANPKYRPLLARTKASAVVVRPNDDAPNGTAAVRCDDPYGAITAAIIRVHGYRRHPMWGVHAAASIAESAKIGPNANIGPHVTISERVVIGRNVNIYPGCYVAENVTLGDDVTLFPNVVIYDYSHIGSRVTIHAGTVIGQDGLGYAPVNGEWLKIPQIGRVVIEDDVELGACCAVDRATMGETRIGKGTKFSDAVVIGHGAKIGQRCMIVAQVGIAGSTKIGNDVTLAGQVGVSGHLTIGDKARVGAKSGVRSDIEPGAEYMGLPAVEFSEFKRLNSLIRRLPQLKQRLADLEAEMARLRQALPDDVKLTQ